MIDRKAVRVFPLPVGDDTRTVLRAWVRDANPAASAFGRAQHVGADTVHRAGYAARPSAAIVSRENEASTQSSSYRRGSSTSTDEAGGPPSVTSRGRAAG